MAPTSSWALSSRRNPAVHTHTEEVWISLSGSMSIREAWRDLDKAVSLLEERVQASTALSLPLPEQEVQLLFHQLRNAISNLRTRYGERSPSSPQAASFMQRQGSPNTELHLQQQKLSPDDCMPPHKRLNPSRVIQNLCANLLGLPQEIWLYIFERLDIKSLGRTACVCSGFRRLVDTPLLWKHKLEALTHHTSPNSSSSIDWKQTVRRKALLAKHWHTGRHHALQLDAHSSRVLHLQFNDEALLSCSMRHLKEWNIKTLALTDTYTTAGNLHSFAFDDQQLFLCAEDAVRCYDRRSKQFQFALNTLYEVQHLKFSPELIVTASGHGYLHLWKNTRGKESPPLASSLQGHNATIHGLDVDPMFTTIATGSSDRSLKIWDISTTLCTGVMRGHAKSVLSVKLAVDARPQLAWTGSRDGVVRLFDLRMQQCVAKLGIHSDAATCLDWDASARRLVSGGADSKIAVVDAAMMRELHCVRNNGGVNCLQIDSERIVAGGVDRHLAIFHYGIN